MAAEMMKDGNDGFAALGGMMAMSLVDNLVDGFVNAETVSRLIENGKMKEHDGLAPAAKADPNWKVERDGLNHFRAYPSGEVGENPPAMIFTRDGLGWRLTDIDVPMNDQ